MDGAGGGEKGLPEAEPKAEQVPMGAGGGGRWGSIPVDSRSPSVSPVDFKELRGRCPQDKK